MTRNGHGRAIVQVEGEAPLATRNQPEEALQEAIGVRRRVFGSLRPDAAPCEIGNWCMSPTAFRCPEASPGPRTGSPGDPAKSSAQP